MSLFDIKNTVASLALLLSGHAASAQTSVASGKNKQMNKTEITVNPEDSTKSGNKTDTTFVAGAENEIQEVIETYENLLAEHGIKSKLSSEDTIYLNKLSMMDKRIGAFTSEIKAGYQLSPVDLIQMKPDTTSIRSAKATSRFYLGKFYGKCYGSVKRTDLNAFPVAYAEGTYAREAIAWYDKNPNFTHVVIDHKDTDKLVEGTTLCMDPGTHESTRASHIYKIIPGNTKKVYKDEKTGKLYPYTVARQRCDGESDTNTTGKKKGIPYGSHSHAFILKTAELSTETRLNIIWQKAEKITEGKNKQIRPKDLWNAYQMIEKASYDLHKSQCQYAEQNFPNYIKKQPVHEVDTARFTKVALPPITISNKPKGNTNRFAKKKLPNKKGKGR